ncbi:MAG: hypothetical protein M0P58_13520, partial [Bacteroidales bacterium]|nr:hypothetical protein [Bacteroidales bacterium]
MKQVLFALVFFIFMLFNNALLYSQNLPLKTCFTIAHQNNLLIRQSQHGIKARQYALTAEKL